MLKSLVNLLLLVILRTSNNNLRKKGTIEYEIIENILRAVKNWHLRVTWENVQILALNTAQAECNQERFTFQEN